MIDFKNILSPYLIAEIAANHNGDMNIVKRLMDAAYACEWDCVKFQKRTVELCIPEKIKGIKKVTPWGDLTYFEYRKRLELTKEQYDFIDFYAKQKPIDWTVSVWDENSLEFIVNYNVPFIKIPSAKLTDWELLRRVCKTGISIILSTGMSSLKEVDKAVNILENYSKSYALLHCCSVYPTPPSEVNLSLIPFLKERYNCVVGFSDHTYGLEASIAAAALGAKILERHVTLDHELFGTDQSSSLEVHAMAMFQKRIKEVNVMFGDGIKKLTDGEKVILEKLRNV